MVLEVECLAREATRKSLQKELERTNKLGKIRVVHDLTFCVHDLKIYRLEC